MNRRPLIRIPPDDAARFVGRKVHVAFAVAGCVWTLVELMPGDVARVRTPKTGREMFVQTRDLCFLRKAEPK